MGNALNRKPTRLTESSATRAGDVVVAHRNRSAFDVWRVSHDGQQQPGPDTRLSMALGHSAALQLGRMMARDSQGAVFVVEADSGTWSKLAR